MAVQLTGWQGWFTIRPDFAKGVAGGTVTALAGPDPNHVDLFMTDSAGRVLSTFKPQPEADYVGWFPVDDTVRMQPGATVTARWASNSHLDLYVTGTDGAVWTIYWELGQGWQGWFTIRPDFAKGVAGGTVTALAGPDPNHVDLFMTDSAGRVLSTFKPQPEADYVGWFPVDDTVRMQPGATVTARWASNSHLDLYVTGTDGAVWTIYWEPAQGWQTRDWFTIRPDFAKGVAGGTVTALAGPDPNHVDLFMTDSAGRVLSTFKPQPEADYVGWFPVDDTVRMQPGATVTPVWKEWPGNPHLDLFVTGTDGAVWSIYWESIKGWLSTDWFTVPSVLMWPGAPVVARWASDTHLDLYVTGTDGAVWSNQWLLEQVVWTQNGDTIGIDLNAIEFDGPPVGGSAFVAISRDGSYTFSGEFHDPGVFAHNVSLAVVIGDGRSKTFSFLHQRDDIPSTGDSWLDVSDTLDRNQEIPAYFDAIASARSMAWSATVETEPGVTLGQVLETIAIGYSDYQEADNDAVVDS